MISRHIPIEPANDNYGRLAKYLARLDEYADEKEKPLMTWCAGCLGGDDYREGIAEATDTQALNTRSKANPTYHLVVSFRPEDEARLTPDTLREIERRFAAVLGLAEHQRHCAVHTDTQNIHIQVAYNLIHPEILTRNDHSWDYAKRDALCRELEREFGLAVDNGTDRERAEGRNEKAVAVEAQQGRQSFAGYAGEHKEALLQALDAAETWQDIHDAFATRGMAIQPQGNGLAVKDRHGRQAMKASDLDRRLSKSRLEKTFGAFLPPDMERTAPEQVCYRSRPVHRGPVAEALFARYQAVAAERKREFIMLKERQEEALAAIREKWRQEKRRLEKLSIHKNNRRNLIQLARKKEAAELATAKAELRREREVFSREKPSGSWTEFLRRSAERGDETALAVLRSGRENAAPEKPQMDHGALAALKAEYAERQISVLESEDLTHRGKKHLLAYLRMDELIQEEKLRGGLVADVTRSVDKKGGVIFTLAEGGRIRDSGDEVFFSGADAAKNLALLYARKKWGPYITLDGGSIRFDRDRSERERQLAAMKKEKGLSR